VNKKSLYESKRKDKVQIFWLRILSLNIIRKTNPIGFQLWKKTSKKVILTKPF